MADMLSIAVSGLQAFQQALNVTSNNIANSSTPGYSVESVNLAPQTPADSGSGYTGAGVTVTNVGRSYSNMLATQMWSASSSLSQLQTFSTNAQTVSNMFADSTTGLSASLQSFTNAVQAVSNAPTSTASRQALLGQASALQQQFQNYNTNLTSLNSQVNSQLTSEASSISSIAQNIATLNGQIATAHSSGATSPNSLLDALGQQIADLAQHVGVTVVNQGNGEANVFIGQGQSLVLGNQAGSVVAQTDQYNPSEVTLGYQSPNSTGPTAPLDATLSGGTVGGLLTFRSQMLDPAVSQLGQVAIGLASAVNAQQASGMDLNGAVGGPLFSVGGVQTLPSSANTGSATVGASVSSVSALTTSNYILAYSGSAWTLRDASTGAAVPLSGAGTSASPLTAAGISMVLSGTPAAGDSFEIQPTAGAVAGMAVQISDPNKIAAATVVAGAASTTNTGAATMSAVHVIDPTNSSLTTPASITFTDATHYTINGAGSYSYTSGGTIAANGWSVQISGPPVAGDTFSVAPNTSGSGDNSNALAMSSVLSQGLLAGGKTSLTQAVTSFVGNVGVATNQSQASLSAQQTVFNNATDAVSSVSGVNLDDEAANLVKYQQAYQAAAQLIKTSETIFNSILTAMQ